MKRTRRGREERDRERDGSSSSGTISVRGEILLYFNLLRLVLFHGPQFKWRTFMMQMQAGAINLSCFPLLGSPDAKDVRSLSPSLCLSLSLSRSLAHPGSLWYSPSLSLHCSSIVLHSPPGHMKNESGAGDAVRGRAGMGRVSERGEEERETEGEGKRERERETPKSSSLTFHNNF